MNQQDCTAGAAHTADPDAAPDLAHVRAVADLLPQLVWTCLPDGYCDYVSRRWVDYTGVPELKHHGRGWLRAVHPADRVVMIRVLDVTAMGYPAAPRVADFTDGVVALSSLPGVTLNLANLS